MSLLRFWTLKHKYEIRRKKQLVFNGAFPYELFIHTKGCCVTLFLGKIKIETDEYLN